MGRAPDGARQFQGAPHENFVAVVFHRDSFKFSANRPALSMRM
jgi:hypothetical protein